MCVCVCLAYRPPLQSGVLVSLCYFGAPTTPLVIIIAVFRLTRCVAALRCTLPVTTSRPLVYARAFLSARGATVPLSSVPRMPQTNKSRKAPAACDPGPVQEAASVDDAGPLSRDESLAAGDRAGGGGGEDNVGDSEITKSPSDPKQYR